MSATTTTPAATTRPSNRIGARLERHRGLLTAIIVFAVLVILPYFAPDLHLVERLIGPPVQWALDHLAAIAGAVAGPEPM